MDTASTTAEYWNSEPEEGLSYLDLLNDPSFPSTTGGEFGQADNASTRSHVNHAVGTASSIASNLSSGTEDIDMSWPLYNAGSNIPGSTSTFNFNLTPASDSDLGYPSHNMDYLARFRFEPTAATAHSPQPDLFLPLPPPIVESSPPGTHSLVPQDIIHVRDNPNKRLRISNITEENILPDHERRKRSKPEKLNI